MGILDTFDFSETEYRAHLDRDYDVDQLRKKHRQKVMKIGVQETGFIAGAGFAPLAAGLSLLSSGYHFRQMHVLEQQKQCIEEALRARDCKVPRERARDAIGGAAIGLITMGLGTCIPDLVGDTIGDSLYLAGSNSKANSLAALSSFRNDTP